MLDVAISRSAKQASPAQQACFAGVSFIPITLQRDKHHLPDNVLAMRSKLVEKLVSMMLPSITEWMFCSDNLAIEVKVLFLCIGFEGDRFSLLSLTLSLHRNLFISCTRLGCRTTSACDAGADVGCSVPAAGLQHRRGVREVMNIKGQLS